MTTDSPKKSDLGVRTLSAIVMVAVAGGALWLGGWVFSAFVVAIGLGILSEYWALVRKIATTPVAALIWGVAGVVYIGVAMAVLILLRQVDVVMALVPIALVVAVDIGAYFAGRTFGGPKIAPSISPSKTWAGLIGGALAAASLVLAGILWFASGMDHSNAGTLDHVVDALPGMAVAALVAIIAQAGDFFESWMKRRAGVKDSGSLIPGHGGLFDRTDGMVAVLFVYGVVNWVAG